MARIDRSVAFGLMSSFVIVQVTVSPAAIVPEHSGDNVLVYPVNVAWLIE